VLADSIKVGSTNLATIRNQASNPAPQINNGATLIDPGKILIHGSTKLSDWRMGGDNTKIDGGHIAANTIAANKLTIGSRGITVDGITVDGITFEHNNPSPNHVYWTSGAIRFTNDAGNSQQIAISEGSAAWSSGRLYIYWVKGSSALSAGSDFNAVNQSHHVILAMYGGTTRLYTNYGRTIIDGSHIKTGTITAQQIHAGAIGAGQIAADAVSAQHIQANAITTAKLAAGAVTADKIVAGAITSAKIAVNAITTDKMAAGSIHGNRIQAGTLNADRIAAGTITATKIKAETVEAGNIKPSAITQVITGSGQFFTIGFNVQHGSVLIMAHATGSGYKNASQSGTTHMNVKVQRNGIHIADIPLILVTTQHWSGGGGSDSPYPSGMSYAYSGTLFLTQVTNTGWQNFNFQINKGTQISNANVSAVIMNYKR